MGGGGVFVSVGEVARLLKCTRSTARRWVARLGAEGVDYVKVDGAMLVRRSFLEKLVAPLGLTWEQVERGEVELLRSRELAERLGCSTNTVFKKVKKGELQPLVIPGRRPAYRFPVRKE